MACCAACSVNSQCAVLVESRTGEGGKGWSGARAIQNWGGVFVGNGLLSTQLLRTACCVFGGWEVRKVVAVTNVRAGNGCLGALF